MALVLMAALAQPERAEPARDALHALDFGARCDGSTDDSKGLAAAVGAANASGQSLYLPAGTCVLKAPAEGVLLRLTGRRIWLKGEGNTVIRLTGTVALTGELIVVALAGEGQGVEGVSFEYAADLSGAFPMHWVSMIPGAFDSTVRDCEFRGGYGGNTAGGAAITSYTPLAGVPVVHTESAAAIRPGDNTITPSRGTGMAGIYIGKRLAIGGEEVIVTARDASGFAAVFAHAHPSGSAITDRNRNTQRILIENNYIHDCFACSGIVLNSGGALVRGNKIVNVGLNSTQHGIYVQSGNNRIVDNWIEGVSGYGIHGHKAVPEEDASGDVYEGNTILDYARQCIVVDSIASGGANPEVAARIPLTRYVTIANNTCRIRKGAGARNVLQGIGVQVGAGNALNAGGALIVNNTLEDACGTTPSCAWISTGDFPNATVSGNHLRVLNGGAPRQTGINSDGGAAISLIGNIVENWSVPNGAALYLASNSTAIGNTISGAKGATVLVAIRGKGVVFCNNTVVQAGGKGIVAQAASQDVDLCGNNLTGPAGADLLDLTAIESGAIHDNSIGGGYMNVAEDGTRPALRIYDNDGEFRWRNVAPSHSVTMTRGMGRLLDFPAQTNPLTAGLAVRSDSAAIS